MAIIMRYGTPGDRAGAVTGESASAIVASGIINDGSSVVLTMEAGGLYELYTQEYAISNSVPRGMRAVLISAPEEGVFGTGAVSHVSICATSNAGVRINYNTDSTITLQQSSTAYAVKYYLVSVTAQ